MYISMDTAGVHLSRGAGVDGQRVWSASLVPTPHTEFISSKRGEGVASAKHKAHDTQILTCSRPDSQTLA